MNIKCRDCRFWDANATEEEWEFVCKTQADEGCKEGEPHDRDMEPDALDVLPIHGHADRITADYDGGN